MLATQQRSDFYGHRGADAVGVRGWGGRKVRVERVCLPCPGPMQLAWKGELKQVSTFFMGTSPEFEFALYTLYFLGGTCICTCVPCELLL